MTAAWGLPVGSSSPIAPPHGLVRHALTALVSHATAAEPLRPAFHPVVLFSPAADVTDRWVADLEQGSKAADASAAVRWNAVDLDAAITAAVAADTIDPLCVAFTTPRLVIVQALERLGSPGRQRVFSRLLDAAAASGTAVCVFLSSPPAAAGFEPGLESRLTSGLVVPLPTPAPARHAATPSPGLRPTCSRVIRATSAHCGIPVTAVLGAGRQRSVVHARSLAMYLSRRLTGKSLDAIGRVFGGRDHSTVLRSVRAVDGRTKEDAAFAGDVERLIVAISGRPRRRPRRTA